MDLDPDEAALMYLGYSGVILRTLAGVVAFDVADLLGGDEIKALKNLDLLLFTHGHGDHYKSRETIEILSETDADIVAEPSLARELRGKVPSEKLTSAEPGKTYEIGEYEVKAIKGIHRGPINLYQVKMGEHTVFHGGDSGYVPLKEYESDLALLPTGRPSPTASPRDALRMAQDLRPKVVLAIHGSSAQSREFEGVVKEKMAGTTILIPEPYRPEKVSL
ncbi:MAG: MBL fold metallo-hydrolase [Candidatus Bathyarchaeota archaeon]|nr:MBL fold metallo-hydrolase [Candidatus Bathyarchaeota archaeon]